MKRKNKSTRRADAVQPLPLPADAGEIAFAHGVSRRVVVVDAAESPLFEQIIYIVRDDAASGGVTAADAFGDVCGDKAQNVRSEGRAHQLAVNNLVRNVVEHTAVHSADIVDRDLLDAVLVHDELGVRLPRIERVHDLHVDIDKRDLIARVVQNLSDKSASDISGAVHNGSFHCKSAFFSFSYFAVIISKNNLPIIVTHFAAIFKPFGSFCRHIFCILSRLYPAADALKAVERLVERLVFFGKMQADEIIHRLAEKAGAGNRADPDVACQRLAEFEVGVESEL